MVNKCDTRRYCFYSNLTNNRNSVIKYRNISLDITQSEDGLDKSEEFESNEECTPEAFMPVSYTSTKSIFFFSCPSDDAALNRILEIVF